LLRDLTFRERVIVVLRAAAYSIDEIAQRISITFSMIRTRMQRLPQKFGPADSDSTRWAVNPGAQGLPRLGSTFEYGLDPATIIDAEPIGVSGPQIAVPTSRQKKLTKVELATRVVELEQQVEELERELMTTRKRP
jgi:hypothetical protein